MNDPYSTGSANDMTEALPCQTQQPELWFAENPADVARAQALCATCSMRQDCLAGAVRRQEQFGVWGGEVFWHGQVVARRPRRGRPPRGKIPA